jgi:hypothetical protein
VVPLSVGADTVEVDDFALVPPGRYRIRVTLSIGEVSDVVLVRQPVEAGPYDPTTRRTESPTGPVMVTKIDASGQWESGRVVSTTVTLFNSATVPIAVKCWWLLGAPTDTRPWDAPATGSATSALLLAAHETRAVPLSGYVTAPAGEYGLSVWVHASGDDGTFTQSDGVGRTGEVRVVGTDPSIARASASVPDISIERLEAPRTWAAGTSPHVRAALRNRTGSPHRLRVWWLVAAPGSSSPWDVAVVTAKSLDVTLRAGAIITVDLPGDVAVRAGTYDLTVVVHDVTRNGETHVDSVKLATPVTVE